MADQWYYAKGGQQLGPVSTDELKQKVASGEVAASDNVWKDGMASWQAASTVPELTGGGYAPAPQAYAAPQAGYAPPAGQPIGYGGYAPQGAPAGPVPNYLVQSILVTLFCCMPLGVVGIVFAAQVNGKLASGDYAGALESSKKAKQFSTWGAIGGGIFVVLYIVLIIAGGVMSR